MQKLVWPLHRVNLKIHEGFHKKKKKKKKNTNVIKAHLFLYVVPV